MKKITFAIGFLTVLLFSGIYGREVYYINGMRDLKIDEEYVQQRAKGTFLYKNHTTIGRYVLGVK